MKQQIDRFTVLEPLGAGGLGSVHKAEENLPGGAKRPVALKILPALASGDKAAEARFFSEVRALAALSGHPHIVTLYGIGITPEQIPWIAMELLPSSLAALISELPAAPGDVARMLEQVATGIAFMHALTPPLLHNDLKPANILVDRAGNFRIADFSLASLIAMERTHVLATVRYAAPELLSREFGKICPATDLYALGHIAFEMALGGRQYRQQFPAVFDERDSSRDASPAKWMAWHCSMTTAAPALHEISKDFPKPLAVIIAKMMAKPTASRYAAASEVLTDLRQCPVLPSSAAPAATPLRPTTAAPIAARVPLAGQPVGGGGIGGGDKPVATVYYVRLRGRVTGPFDLATLQRQSRQGFLSRLHQISTDQTTWRPAAALEGLFGNPTTT